MFYNKSMMQEAGLDPDKPPTTIAELDAMAEKMFKKNSNGTYDQVGIIPWMAQGFLYTHGWNFGGQWERNGELMPTIRKSSRRWSGCRAMPGNMTPRR